jgi:hypothetical protein
MAERAMKDVGMRIRVEAELRDAFTHTCREKDVPASRVLREFMKQYVATCGRGVVSERTRDGFIDTKE